MRHGKRLTVHPASSHTRRSIYCHFRLGTVVKASEIHVNMYRYASPPSPRSKRRSRLSSVILPPLLLLYLLFPNPIFPHLSSSDTERVHTRTTWGSAWRTFSDPHGAPPRCIQLVMMCVSSSHCRSGVDVDLLYMEEKVLAWKIGTRRVLWFAAISRLTQTPRSLNAMSRR